MQQVEHSHGDLIFLSALQNPPVDSMDEEKLRAMGKRIAELREDKGLTQPRLAQLAGIKQSSLWSIENGQTKAVTAVTLINLCRALSTTWEYLFFGGDAATAVEEAELIAIFRQLEPPARSAVLQSARTVIAATRGIKDEDAAILQRNRPPQLIPAPSPKVRRRKPS